MGEGRNRGDAECIICLGYLCGLSENRAAGDEESKHFAEPEPKTCRCGNGQRTLCRGVELVKVGEVEVFERFLDRVNNDATPRSQSEVELPRAIILTPA